MVRRFSCVVSSRSDVRRYCGNFFHSGPELKKEIELGQKVAAEVEGHWNRIVDPVKPPMCPWSRRK
jgi:hypothetical protein